MPATPYRRRLLLVPLAFLGLLVHCTSPSDSLKPVAAKSQSDASPAAPSVADSARPSTHAGQSVAEIRKDQQARPDANANLIRFRFRPDRPLYYVIENEFVDHGGVPGLLSYTTVVTDRRTITQTVLPEAEKGSSDGANSVRLSWVCDRYEVTEKGMKEKVHFDSLRDLYPRAALRKLGSIPGSKVVFEIDPRTGRCRHLRITPGKNLAPRSRKKLSSTARRCALTRENLSLLLDDVGSLFIPDKAEAVGESWTRRREEGGKGFGRAIRDYTFTLTGIREDAGRKIARIAIRGDVRLAAVGNPQTSAPAGKRGVRRIPSRASRKFKIDRKLCDGSIEFDMTHGELVRLTLRQALDLSAKMESKKQNKAMSIETGSSQVLRVQVRHTPPPEPMIVGGPKPPPEEPEQAAGRAGVRAIGRGVPPTRPRAGQRANSARGGPTSQSARSGRPVPPRRRVRPSLSQRRREQLRLPRRAIERPTSQPSSAPH